jgi:hypothetical protein
MKLKVASLLQSARIKREKKKLSVQNCKEIVTKMILLLKE